MQELLDFSPDVICIADKEGRFIEVSAAAKAVWGYDPSELKGRPFIDLVVEEDRPLTEQTAANVVKGTILNNFQNHYRCKDGRIKPILWSAKWNSEQEVVYCIARDGSERQAAEKKAADYEQQLYQAYKLAGIGWWELKVDTNQISTSGELYDIYGLTPAGTPHFTRDHFLSLVHPDDLSQVLQHLAQVWTKEYYQFDHRLIKATGEVIHVIHYVQPVRDETGRVMRIHGTTKDISQRKSYELALHKSQQRLEDIVESLGDGFFALDRAWKITYWNKKAEHITLRKRADVVGGSFWDLYPKAKALKFFTEFNRAVSENRPVYFEEYSPTHRAWMEVSAYPSQEGLSVFVKDITRRRQQEEERLLLDQKLQQAREHLRNVLQNMSDGFFTVNREWTITYATERIAATLGLKKEEYVGRNLWACFPDAVDTRFYTEYHRAFAENTLVSFEEYYAPLDKWLEVNACPGQDELAIYQKDITDRKRQEKRLEFMAKATSEVIWERALDGDQVEVNGDKLKQLTGYDIGGNYTTRSFWRDKTHPDDLPRLRGNRDYALLHDFEFYVQEYRFRKADGSWLYVKDRIHVIKNDEGKAVRLIGALEDITSERLTEKAIVESEKSYRQLFNNAPLPSMIFNAESFQFLDVNSTAVEHYGYTREEFLSMSLLDIRPVEELPKAFLHISRQTLHNKVSLGVITHYIKGRKKILVEATVTKIIYKGQNAYLATVHDVTEKLRLQNELTRGQVNHQKDITKAIIETQEKERSEIGKELHDNVNQMLTTAKLYVENINYYPEQRALFANRSVGIIQDSINEIRRLSRALVTPTIRDVGFKDTLGELVASYLELALFEVHTSFDFDEAAVPKGIKLTVYRILQEAFNNTVKYAGASMVRVVIRCSGNTLKLAYVDDGAGFDPATVKRGIGLQNIQNRTDAYRGKVQIRSSAGAGCELKIIFPLAGPVQP